MALTFKKDTSKWGKEGTAPNVAYLWVNNWDDYSYKSTFKLTIVDSSGASHEIGDVKVGYVGQPKGWTAQSMPDEFEFLPAEFFSLGQSTEYYSALRALPDAYRFEILSALRDVVWNHEVLALASQQEVFQTSLLRGVNYASINEQFKRILDGGAVRTEYHFGYRTSPKPEHAEFALTFDVYPNVNPSQNIHVLIGRNGIGKTTLLNGMIAALTNEREQVDGAGYFFDMSALPQPTVIAIFSGSDHSTTSTWIPPGTAAIASTSCGDSKARAIPSRCSV